MSNLTLRYQTREQASAWHVHVAASGPSASTSMLIEPRLPTRPICPCSHQCLREVLQPWHHCKRLPERGGTALQPWPTASRCAPVWVHTEPWALRLTEQPPSLGNAVPSGHAGHAACMVFSRGAGRQQHKDSYVLSRCAVHCGMPVRFLKLSIPTFPGWLTHTSSDALPKLKASWYFCLAVRHGPLNMFSIDHWKAILLHNATFAARILWVGALHSPDYTVLGGEAIT